MSWRFVVAVALAALAVMGPVAPAAFALPECPGSGCTRLEGANRYETSVAVSREGWPGGADEVWVATGATYPDALAASAAAGWFGAPLLLVRTGSVPSAVDAELKRLRPGTIVIVGGEIAVSAAVEAELGRLPSVKTVKRLAGANRYGTAAAIYTDRADLCDAREVFLATGRDFPDALSGAALGGSTTRGANAILLANDSGVPEQTIAAMKECGPSVVTLLGGSSVLPDSVQAQVSEQVQSVTKVQRLAGANRYETSVKIAAAMKGSSPTTAFLAVGDNYPDALAGGPAAANEGSGAPLVLTRTSCMPGAVSSGLTDLGISRVTLLGGPAALADGVTTTRCVSTSPVLEVVSRPSDGSFDMVGRGWGHGRGMSQWGAYEAGRTGVSWGKILDTYYPGTSRTSGSTGIMRVLLEADTGYDVIARPESGLRILWTAQNGQSRSEVAPGSVNGCTALWWRVRATGSDLAIEYLCGSSWNVWKSAGDVDGNQPVTFRPSDGTIDTAVRTSSGFTRKGYRGDLEGRRSGSSMAAVNVVPTEEYLRSVVPSEVPTSWSTETLRAQAVAARSYAMRERYDRSGWFDVYDSTRSQVYKGRVEFDDSWNVTRTYEDSRTDAAVAATAGTYLTYNGIPAFTQFSSSNGGWSAQGSQPYLSIRRDDWDRNATANPYREWQDSVSVSSLESRYSQIGRLERLRVTARDGGGAWGGRITEVVLEGSSGSVTIRGDSAIRSAFGTRSSYFTLL